MVLLFMYELYNIIIVQMQSQLFPLARVYQESQHNNIQFIMTDITIRLPKSTGVGFMEMFVSDQSTNYSMFTHLRYFMLCVASSRIRDNQMNKYKYINNCNEFTILNEK